MVNGIVKSVKTVKYLQLHNEPVQDVLTDLKAVGLLTYIMSLPENYRVYKTKLHKKWGRGPVETAFKELKKHRYYFSVKCREGKKDMYCYFVSDVPFTDEKIEEIISEIELPIKEVCAENFRCRFSTSEEKADEINEFSDVGFGHPKMDNPKQTSIKEIDKKEIDKKEILNNHNLNHNHENTTDKIKEQKREDDSPKKKDEAPTVTEVLGDTEMPKRLKTKIKIMIDSNKISLTTDEILRIEQAYHHHVRTGNVIPDCGPYDYKALNDFEFTESVAGVLLKGKGIRNMNGMIKSFVEKSLEKKRNEEYVPVYDWFGEMDDKQL